MASPKTKEFEIFVNTDADSTGDNTVLDLTDYVDIADNQAFEIHEVSMVLNPEEELSNLTQDAEAIFQLADSNIAAFVSHADRTSLYVCRQTFDATTLGMYEMESFSSITPLVVSKTLWLRNKAIGQAGINLSYTLRMKGRIVTPSAKDYMALVLTQTGNVA